MVKLPLHKLKSALNDDDREQVVELAPDVQNSFDRRRSQERAYDELANVVKIEAVETDSGSDAANAAAAYLNAVTAADQARMAVDMSLINYINDGTNPTGARELVESALDAETSLDDAVDEFSLQIDESDLSVPPVLVVTGPDRVSFPKNLERTYEYSVANVGGEAITDVTLELDSALEIDVTPSDLGSISPDGETAIELSGSLSETGVHTIKVSAISDSEKDSISVTVGVASKVEYLQSTVQDVVNLKSDVAELREKTDEDSENSKKNRDGLRGLEQKADQVIQKLEKAIEWIEAGKNGRPVNEKIESAINQMGSFINHIESISGKQLDGGDAALLRHNAREVIPRLETAIEMD